MTEPMTSRERAVKFMETWALFDELCSPDYELYCDVISEMLETHAEQEVREAKIAGGQFAAYKAIVKKHVAGQINAVIEKEFKKTKASEAINAYKLLESTTHGK
jgi:hypothetical protein